MTTTEARDWLAERIDELGTAFHPDTPFAEYIDRDPLYTADEAARFDREMAEVFDALAAAGTDPYEVALALLHRAHVQSNESEARRERDALEHRRDAVRGELRAARAA